MDDIFQFLKLSDVDVKKCNRKNNCKTGSLGCGGVTGINVIKRYMVKML